jgi:DNA mismatch endonuclease (patch repair protein)
MDIKSPEERSKNMAAIRSQNTKPEVYLRKLLFAQGYRYSLNSKNVPGHPDIYLRKYNTAIFVHGCFWHRHEGCKYASMPKSRVGFWEKKFEANQKRDCIVQAELQEKGFRYIIIWECTIRKMMKDEIMRANVVSYVQKFLESKESCMQVVK